MRLITGDGDTTKLILSGGLSGTLPSGLRLHLEAESARLSGTLSSDVGTRLGLEYNRLSGTLPSNSLLLEELRIPHNQLSGSILAGDMWEPGGSLRHLDLKFNLFELPPPPQLVTWCSAARDCEGLPPASCSAFRDAALGAMNPGECVSCPDDVTPTLLLLLGALVGSGAALLIYLRLISCYPDFRGWIATSGIVIGQLHLLAIVGALAALADSFTSTVIRWFNALFFDTTLAQPECLWRTADATLQFLLVPTLVFLGPALIWLFASLAKCAVGGCCWLRCIRTCREPCYKPATPPKDSAEDSPEGRGCSVDLLEQKCVTIFSTLFGTVCKLWMYGLAAAGTTDRAGIFYVLFGFQTIFALNLLRDVRALRRETARETARTEPRAAGGCCFEGCCCCWRPHPKARLEVRLQYIVAQYGDHAPYWQFVVWLRELGMVAATKWVPSSLPAVQSAVSLGEVLIYLGLLRRIKPYARPGTRT